MAGVLDPPSIGVASATLTLEADARLEAAIKLQGTVRAQPTDADYLALSGPAAVWVQYEVVRVQRPEEVEPNAGKSNAILRLALDRRLAGDEEGARAGLEDAVAANAQNWAAHVLLAITLAGSAGSDYRLAIQILEDALAEMKGTGGVAAYRDDPNYWRLSYQLAAQRLNSFVASGGTGAGENRDAQLAESGARRLVDEAGEAIARCEQELEDAGARKEDLSTRRLLRFMQRTVKPCAEIVLAATEVRGEARAAAADKRVADVRASGINVPLSYRVHYNFACYEADRAGPKPGGGERPPAQEERAERALDDLRAALRKSHGPARTELIARAGTDPSLAPVREDPGHRDRFARLLGLYGLSAGGVR
jgi:hypothetical protein